MKKLSLYITEKFKISKDIGNNTWAKGDKLLKIDCVIKNDSSFNEFYTTIVTFENYDSNSRISFYNKIYGSATTPTLFVNSNGYYEYIHKNEKADIYKVIFLPKPDAIKFMSKFEEQSGITMKKYFKNYYDEADKNIFSKPSIYSSFNISAIKKELDIE